MSSSKLQHWLRLSPLRNARLYHLVRFYAKQDRLRKLADRHGDRPEDVRTLMKEAMVKYHWDFDEFYMYGYRSLTPEERRSFVPEYDKNVFCDKVNDYEDSLIFDSKWASYCRFQPFYKRDCVLVVPPSVRDNQELAAFLQKHPRCIVKPDSNASGRGIFMVDGVDAADAMKQIVDHIGARTGRFIAEELIAQSPEISRFHPSSVNSLRVRTFRFDDRVEVLPSNFRIGRGGSVVDNTGAGGISAALDENGVVIAACGEAGDRFETHPDTGVRILGARIPHWEEAVAFVKQLAMVLPSVRYVGWDLALTDDGWVMIEGNDKGMLVGVQKPLNKGFRPQLDKILSEIGVRL